MDAYRPSVKNLDDLLKLVDFVTNKKAVQDNIKALAERKQEVDALVAKQTEQLKELTEAKTLQQWEKTLREYADGLEGKKDKVKQEVADVLSNARKQANAMTSRDKSIDEEHTRIKRELDAGVKKLAYDAQQLAIEKDKVAKEKADVANLRKNYEEKLATIMTAVKSV